MKKVLYTLGLLACTSVAAQAQTSALKLNLFSLAVSTGSLAFEHKVGDTNSFQIGAFYTGFSIGDTKFSGFGITPEYRIYVTGEALQGFYLGPYLRYQNFNLSDDSNFSYTGSTNTKNEASLNTFGGGVNLGYQWVFKQHIVLEPFLRVGYNKGSVKVKSGGDNYDLGSFDGFSLLPGLNLGYAF
jgi:outer membrane autotransporter protein